ncbi:MAG: ferrous iron transporter B, partial [Spirulina sp. DLM2.Bin59]
LSIGDVSDLDAVAAEQDVAYTTVGQMALRFERQVGAFAYLLFILMYFPCVAAMGAVYRETNGGWTAFVGLWTTGLGYWSAVLFYQVVTFTQHPATATAWIVGLGVGAIATILLMRYSQPQRGRSRLLPEKS